MSSVTAAPVGGVVPMSRRVMNLAHIVTQNARRLPAHAAFIQGDLRHDWKEFDTQVSALAAGLKARGIGKGDRLLVHSKNCDAMFVSMFATFRLGAVWVPTNFRLLPDEVSELEVMRRYELGRPEAQKLLARLADLDMVERKPGYGWRFLHEPRDQRLRDESYRFRLLIEPMAMLEPGFGLDPAWIAEMRTRHLEALQRPWRESSSIAFYEMNADFHEGLAAATGNRFFHSAMRRQNQLRRLSNYDWDQGLERVRVNCTEHLGMLDHLEAGENEVASALMRSHLLRASKLRRMPKVEEAK